MTQLYEIKVSLSPNQKKNLSNAYHKRETIILRLTKDSLSGNDTLYVPQNIVKRLQKNQKLKKGMDKYSKPVQIHRGENAVYKFMDNMLEEVNWCKSKMKKHFNKPLKMTKENETDFQKAAKCHICDKPYKDKRYSSKRSLSYYW